jgi:anti-sigma regulatory factor (Ser/Thr protein kinase)
MRSVLRTFLDGCGVDQEVIAPVVLAADEAFANAVTHGHGKRAVSVSARVSRRQISVEIRDHGRGFAPRRHRPRPVPDTSRVHGRGVFLIEGLMDEVEIRPRRHGTTVRMVRRLA